jgi:phage/conjugal plasmid C-4 type zinc finger TraR family protein
LTDLVDLANDHADMLLRHALEEQRHKAAAISGQPADGKAWRALSATDCEGPHCGEPIPDERRRLLPGVRLCVDCQARLEKGMGR